MKQINHSHCKECRTPIHSSKTHCKNCEPIGELIGDSIGEPINPRYLQYGFVDPGTGKPVTRKIIKKCPKCDKSWIETRGVGGNMVYEVEELK